MIQKAKNGFTLLELIVVIAIIGSLAAIFTTTYPASQRKARDATRKSDIKQYQTGLEVYANKNNGVYPSSGGSVVTANTTLCSYLGLSSGTCSPDPKDGKSVCTGTTCRYYYLTNNCGASGTACATSYAIWGPLENPQDTTKKYFVVCSNGKVGEGGSVPTPGNICPV